MLVSFKNCWCMASYYHLVRRNSQQMNIQCVVITHSTEKGGSVQIDPETGVYERKREGSNGASKITMAEKYKGV